MSFAVGLALLVAGAFAVLISAGVFLLLIKLLSPALVLGLLFTALAIAALVAWQACFYLLAISLMVLACLAAASTIAISAKDSSN
jgi:hypothetical protein